MTVFSYKDFGEVIKVQLSHKCGVGLSSGSTWWPGISWLSNSMCRSGLDSSGGISPFTGLFLSMGFFPRGLPSEGRAGSVRAVGISHSRGFGGMSCLCCQKDMVSYISHPQGCLSEAGSVAIEKTHFGVLCFPVRNLIFLLLSS